MNFNKMMILYLATIKISVLQLKSTSPTNNLNEKTVASNLIG